MSRRRYTYAKKCPSRTSLAMCWLASAGWRRRACFSRGRCVGELRRAPPSHRLQVQFVDTYDQPIERLALVERRAELARARLIAPQLAADAFSQVGVAHPLFAPAQNVADARGDGRERRKEQLQPVEDL